MLDASWWVAEATAANIFVVRDGEMTTPVCTAALPGITRAVVFELAAALGLTARESFLTIGDVYAADEIS